MATGLRQRVVTAVILGAGFLAALGLLPRAHLAALLGAVVAVAAWEWAMLMGLARVWSRALYPAAVVLGMLFLFRHCRLGAEPRLDEVQSLLGLAGLWWAIALLWVKGYPGSGRIWGNVVMLGLMGLLVLLPAWLGAVYLLSGDNGRLLLLGLVLVVAATDIGAYFFGLRFGRRKLAPAVSPGKSWEGFWGGLLASLSAAGAVGLVMGASWLPLLALVACTSLASVLGDLVESMVKRHRGVKDSGAVLPGHGGVLDRIDGITAAAPVFALGVMLAGWLP